jgi:tricarballylate dehydrogenase
MHDAPQDVLVDAYPEEEYWQDLLKVTGGQTNEHLARLVIRSSATFSYLDAQARRALSAVAFRGFAYSAYQRFFYGGGKALVNAYYLSAERHGIAVDYNARVSERKLVDGRFEAARADTHHRNRGKPRRMGARQNMRISKRRLRVQP